MIQERINTKIKFNINLNLNLIMTLIIIFSSLILAKVSTVYANDSSNQRMQGIYCLDSSAGQYRDANIRNYSFIEGYAWRPKWSDMDTAQGYDFNGVDHIISKLESIDKKLHMCVIIPEPEYIRNDETIQRWYDNSVLVGNTEAVGWRPTPWDQKTQNALQAFAQALASHEVYSKTPGKYVQLRDHPVLTGVSFAFSGIRDPTGGSALVNMSGYSRDNFKNAIIKNVHSLTDNFPNKVGYMGFWAIKNDGGTTELWKELMSVVLDEFDGAKNPKVGFFQENLAASKSVTDGSITGYPRIEYGAPLYLSKNQMPIDFQALQGWKSPFSNPEKTANTVPSDAIRYAFENYKCRYIELYVSDLDYAFNNPEWDPALFEWCEKLILSKVDVQTTFTKNQINLDTELTSNIKVTNYIDTQKSVCVFMILYDDENRIKQIITDSKIIGVNESNIFILNMIIPSQIDNYKAKVLVWEGYNDLITTMNPLSNSITFSN